MRRSGGEQVARILPFSTVRARPPDAPVGRPAQPPTAGRRDAGGAPLSRAEAERFRAMVLPHLDSAYTFARYLARDPVLAEDIVQDAMLKAFRGFAGFRGGDPRAWLFAIVRSTFLSWARSRPTWTSDAETPETASEDDTPEEALLRQGEVRSVRDAIGALAEPFRETLVLRELEDLSYREIAEVTGVPLGTVMSRLARARQLLITALRPEPQS